MPARRRFTSRRPLHLFADEEPERREHRDAPVRDLDVRVPLRLGLLDVVEEAEQVDAVGARGHPGPPAFTALARELNCRPGVTPGAGARLRADCVAVTPARGGRGRPGRDRHAHGGERWRRGRALRDAMSMEVGPEESGGEGVRMARKRVRDCDARAWSFTRLLVRQTSESTRDQSLTAATSTWRSCPNRFPRGEKRRRRRGGAETRDRRLSGKSKRLRVGASNVFADEVLRRADALRGARLARAHLKHLKAQFTRTRMPRTTPRAHRASRTHTASRGDDARRRGSPRVCALFSLLLCSSRASRAATLGAEGRRPVQLPGQARVRRG